MGGFSARAMGIGYGAGGYLIAGGIGAGVIMACAAVLPALVALGGNCIIFANVSDNLPTGDYESRLTGAMDSMKQKASATRQQLDEQSQKPQTAVATPAQTTASACPQCKGAIAADDGFCGHCGHKLK